MKVIISIFLLSISSCISNQQFQKNQLIGSWKLDNNSAINYPLIVFNKDKSAVFSSRSDTLLRFTFKLKGSTLTLTNVDGINYNCPISKLTYDSLVFDNLLAKKNPQVYLKKGN
ncbi:MAG: hypothetical protein JWM14_234 [Chitinophagaceae bacterium]|nr:hypothetical protein [Chitinophagaceae bacterium]